MHNPFRLLRAPPVPRLRDAADAFVASPRRRQISAQRLAAYRAELAAFAAWAGPNRRISDIGPEEADAYARRIPHYLAAATYADKLSTLRTAWTVLVPRHPNPWQGIARRPPDARPREPLTRQEINTVIAAAETHGRAGPELAMLIRVGAWTGLRLGDAVRLRWDAVREREISLRTRKTGRQVEIPILAPLRTALDAWRTKCGSVEALFPRLSLSIERNHGLTQNVGQQVCRVMRQCGLATSYAHEHTSRRRPLRGFHSLRHAFVTSLVEAGLPADIVAAIVGHASAAMTLHYTHVRAEFVRDALAKAGLA